MNETYTQLLAEPFKKFVGSMASFLPGLILAFLILVAGLAASRITGTLIQKFLAAVGLDRQAMKSGILDLMRRGGIELTFSELVGRLAFWILALMFLIISLSTLNIPQIDRLLSAFFLYLPNVITAAFLAFVGYLLSNFLAKAALVSAVNAGWRMPGLLSKCVKILVLLLAATVALEQLGVGRGTILTVFSISFGGLVLALALAFGLGGRDIAREFLEKRLREDRQEDKDEIGHI